MSHSDRTPALPAALSRTLPHAGFTAGPAYRAATSPRNATADQRPGVVVRAETADDVARCVAAAAEAGSRLAVQATGHGAAGGLDGDTWLLDTSRLDSVEVDAGRRIVRAGAGATFAAVNEAAFRHGLLALAGTAPDVAVTGYTAHGGVGWLTRPHGLASASLSRVDLVDGTGSPLTADDDRHADVLWAYRGGGGVGVATALELRLFPAEQLWAGYLLWPVSAAGDILPAWGTSLADLHPAVTTSVGLLHAPDSPAVPEELRGQVVVHLCAATVAGQSSLLGLRGLLEGWPEPSLDTLGPCDATRLSTIHLDPPGPVPAVGDGRWLTAEAGQHVLQILTAAGTTTDSPLAEVELRHVGGPASTVAGAQTTCPGDLLLHLTGAAPDAPSREAVGAALEEVLSAARPVDTGRSAASFRDGRTTADDALPPEVQARLRQIRHEVDPQGLVRPARRLS